MRPVSLTHCARLAVLCAGLGSLGCSSDGEAASESRRPVPEVQPNELIFDTPDFDVTPGKEKYLCFTKTLDEDVWIDRFHHDDQPTIHHLVLVKTLAPESDEPFECPTFFKPTWIPLFATGTAEGQLETPEGSSF